MQDYNELCFERILKLLHEERGIDFSLYKEPCLKRRIASRVQRLNLKNWSSYYRYIKHHPEEFNKLIETITINVTRFFRDEGVYKELEYKILPDIIHKKLLQGMHVLRFWSAGCATGEEAYSLIILFKEVERRTFLNETRKHFTPLRLSVYATDIDEKIIAKAKKGIFSEKSVANIPDFIRKHYFEAFKEKHRIISEIRRKVHFYHSNLTGMKHFTCFDLILCRNVMIYFNEKIQTKIIWQFYKSLNQNGYLVLGKSESLPREAFTLFKYVNNRERIFKKK